MDARKESPASFRIAVLDDSATSRLLIERILLRHLGCHVRTFETAAELRAACDDDPPDLYLIDFTLGDQSGADVCRALKADPRTRDVPVFFFSDHGQPRTRIEALHAGGVDYLDKPFYPEEFLQRVRGCIERFRHQQLLESQTREQQALLRVLCHDLRNSVGAAHTVLQLLQDEEVEDRVDYLAISLSAARSALDLIEHVAEYRSLLDETRPFKLEPVSLASACAESVNILGLFAAKKDVRLHVDAPPGIVLAANRVVLVHNILNNLINNAVKFSRPGSTVHITGVLEHAPSDLGAECVIRVRDEGIGIPADILAQLLKHQPVCSRPGTAHEPGTGIGMNLVHLYVERCGGRVTLESRAADRTRPELPSGTTVTLRFPVAAA